MQPFNVIEPAGGESPVVVEVPHAGLAVDAESLAHLIVPARRIGHDADLAVDELFADAPSEGATLIVASQSRYVVDLNRAESDYDAESVEGGPIATAAPRGVIWRLSTFGEPLLARPLARAELARRIDTIYRPYHQALEGIVARKRARFGHVIVISAHSMPGRGRAAQADPGLAVPDVIPGTRGRTTAAGAVIDRVDELARALGLVVRHDDPYRGGFTTARHGRPSEAKHAVQIEIARTRYMDEATLRIEPHGFRAIRHFARTLVARLASVQTLRSVSP